MSSVPFPAISPPGDCHDRLPRRTRPLRTAAFLFFPSLLLPSTVHGRGYLIVSSQSGNTVQYSPLPTFDEAAAGFTPPAPQDLIIDLPQPGVLALWDRGAPADPTSLPVGSTLTADGGSVAGDRFLYVNDVHSGNVYRYRVEETGIHEGLTATQDADWTAGPMPEVTGLAVDGERNA